MTVYRGGPAGIEALAASMGQERDTLEDMVEPYLLQAGFIVRTVPSWSMVVLALPFPAGIQALPGRINDCRLRDDPKR